MKLYMINQTDPFYQAEIQLFLTREKAIESKMKEFEGWYERMCNSDLDIHRDFIKDLGYTLAKEYYMSDIEEIEAVE